MIQSDVTMITTVNVQPVKKGYAYPCVQVDQVARLILKMRHLICAV